MGLLAKLFGREAYGCRDFDPGRPGREDNVAWFHLEMRDSKTPITHGCNFPVYMTKDEDGEILFAAAFKRHGWPEWEGLSGLPRKNVRAAVVDLMRVIELRGGTVVSLERARDLESL